MKFREVNLPRAHGSAGVGIPACLALSLGGPMVLDLAPPYYRLLTSGTAVEAGVAVGWGGDPPCYLTCVSIIPGDF